MRFKFVWVFPRGENHRSRLRPVFDLVQNHSAPPQAKRRAQFTNNMQIWIWHLAEERQGEVQGSGYHKSRVPT